MTRVLVVGGGVIGLFGALHARRRGFDVTLVDRDPAGGRGCSFVNAGMVVPSHFVPLAAPGVVRLAIKWMRDPASPLHVKPRASWDFLTWSLRFARAATHAHVQRAAPLLRDLALASRDAYEAFDREAAGAFGLERHGLLVACATAHGFDEERRVADQAHALGMPAVALAGPEAIRFDPLLRDDVAGAIHYPLDCHLDPDRLMAWLQAAVAREGVQIVRGVEVRGFAREGGRLRAALTAQGELEADEFVLCGGAWSPLLARTLGVALPIEAGKGYSVTIDRPVRFPAHCAILSEARVALTPIGARLRIGGTMQLAGLDDAIDPDRVRAIARALPRYYRDVEEAAIDEATPSSGLRPCTPDGLPFIGRTSRHRNLVVAAGHAMMGVSLGAVTGRIVAQLLAGEPPPFDMALLSPDRFD